MKRLILALLHPVIQWCTNGKYAQIAIVRDHTGAYEWITCPCGVMTCRRFDLEDLRIQHAIRVRAAYESAEGCPELGPDDLQYY